jgi:hypothetical protein
MKRFVCIILGSFLALTLANAALSKGNSGPTRISASAGEGWRLSCLLQLANADSLRRSIDGRGIAGVISMRRVVAGECDWSTSPEGDALTLTFTDENSPEKCPLAREGDTCTATFPAGQSGSFEF